MKKIIPVLLLPVVLFSCNALTGEEVARLPINTISTEDSVIIKESTLDLKKGDEIKLWSDMDVEYEGEVGMRFRVQVWARHRPGRRVGN